MKFSNEMKLLVMTTGYDFNYVEDSATGFIELAKSDKTTGQEINLATGTEYSIGDVAERLIRMIRPQARIVCDKERIRPENSEVERLLGSAEKLFSLTHWRPQYDLAEGLERTVKWFSDKKNLSQYKPQNYNV